MLLFFLSSSTFPICFPHLLVFFGLLLIRRILTGYLLPNYSTVVPLLLHVVESTLVQNLLTVGSIVAAQPVCDSEYSKRFLLYSLQYP
jgi:hypothetical protein